MDLLRSLPIGLYLDSQVTWLHRLDPRVKLAWLMTFLLSPLLSSSAWRIALVGLLILLTIAATIPLRVWRQQLGLLLTLCGLIFAITAIMPDGMGVSHQARLPADELNFAQLSAQAAPLPPRPNWFQRLWPFRSAPTPEVAPGVPSLKDLPQPTPYRYVVFEQGRIRITRRSVELGLRLSTLLFTLIYGTNLYLLTTAPEEITTGLERLFQPLRKLRLPVTEIVLTLTLALRFIPLVLEEIQNLARAIRTRAINWKKIGPRGAIKIWFMLADRLLGNLFLRAEQVASAMQVRGFTTPEQHRSQWNQLRLQPLDWFALAGILVFWALRFRYGNAD
jgi:energy-coupling factor transport system permease protein